MRRMPGGLRDRGALRVGEKGGITISLWTLVSRLHTHDFYRLRRHRGGVGSLLRIQQRY